MRGTFAIAQENGTLAFPMLTVPAGSGFRLGLVVLLAIVTGCAANPSTGSIEVLVKLEPGLISRCVKVTARDGVNAKETKAIPLEGKMSPLKIGMSEDGLVSPVTLQAFGYTDVGCTILSADEKSATEVASYETPTRVVTLTLAPAANGDGGRDGGTDGGTDAGVDAGIDNDLDGYPVPADCNDANPNIHPNASESCADGIDNDCNSLVDCADSTCNGFACPNSGTCVGTTCISSTEICTDGVDNNNNGLIDCADPNCVMGTMCTDSNACTTGDRCVGGGVCQKTGDVACTSPPAAQCYSATGMCLADAGASCFYAPTTGNCNDNLGCTLNDTCDGDGGCVGTPKACTQATNTCVATTGSCAEPSGTCAFAALPSNTGTCSDGNNCTTGDTCDGDGGCQGNVVSCIPNQCQTASTGCTGPGACIFGNKNGQACDAGTGGPATCDTSFNCNAAPSSLFPYPPSNFAESDLPTDGGLALTLGASRTLNTDNTPTLSGTSMPPFRIFTPTGGVPTVLVSLTGLNVTGTNVLTITGARPLIIAVVGNVQIDGKIVARNAGTPAACGNGGNGGSGSGNGIGGGGGGGFGSIGGVGGTTGGTAATAGPVNGGATLTPLRGGCKGGNASAANGGTGGGAFQLTVSGTLSLNGFIAAPGGGGNAGTNNSDGAGGGGSGGGILLEGASVTFSGLTRLTANGGSGGEGAANNGTNGSAGSEGNDNSTTATPGGSGSSSGGNGGAGAAGTTAAGSGSGAGSDNDGSGGGGGGVGRVRVNATTCMKNGTGQVFSPAFTGATCN